MIIGRQIQQITRSYLLLKKQLESTQKSNFYQLIIHKTLEIKLLGPIDIGEELFDKLSEIRETMIVS